MEQMKTVCRNPWCKGHFYYTESDMVEVKSDIRTSKINDVLSEEEFYNYKSHLRSLTKKAISNEYNSTINKALRDIDELSSLQGAAESRKVNKDSFSISDNINTLISECVEFGTTPFSILARHGFIAEGILRSAVSNGAISKERLLLH